MFAVIFEVEPKPGCTDEYLETAKALRPELDRIGGCISVERFGNLRRQGVLLSWQTWRDEAAIVRWREHEEHRGVQARGRRVLFADYRLRVGEVTYDSAAGTAPRPAETTVAGALSGHRKVATVTEIEPDAGPRIGDLTGPSDAALAQADGRLDHHLFESLYAPGKHLLLASWRDEAAASAWELRLGLGGRRGLRHLRVRIVRDYGMTDRHEAPSRRAGETSVTPAGPG